MTGTEMHLGENEALLSFFASFDPDSFITTLVFLFLGGVMTFCVQSSAAVMAITMILCSSGALPIYQGIALVMGENIGTTVTSNLAAMSANTQARRAALAHMFFNVFGVIWILFVFRPFIDMVCGWVGYDVDMQKEAVETSVFLANSAKLSFVLAAFHTAFNVANTFIEEDEFRLHFITAGFMKTPELSVLEAQKEIQSFSERMQRMFGMVRELLTLSSSASNKKDSKAGDFNKLFTRIEKYEGISDNMELEIAKYLDSVSDAHLSDDTKAKMARTISRKYNGKEDHFIEKQYDHIHQMMELTDQSLSQMNRLMKGRKESFDVNRSFNIEHEINNYRNQLKRLGIR